MSKWIIRINSYKKNQNIHLASYLKEKCNKDNKYCLPTYVKTINILYYYPINNITYIK